MAARSMFSHNSIQDLNGKQMKEKMLKERGIDWENFYPVDSKRGSFFQRITTERQFTTEELKSLPEKHQARLNPSLTVKRSEVKKVVFPPLVTIANLPEVLFSGAEMVERK